MIRLFKTDKGFLEVIEKELLGLYLDTLAKLIAARDSLADTVVQGFILSNQTS